MRCFTFFLTVVLLLSFGVAIGQKPLTTAQKKRILENREFFLSYNILLSDYNFENAEMNDALLSAAKHYDSWRTLRKAGWIVTGTGLGLVAVGAVGGGLLAIDSEGAFVAGAVLLVTGITVGIPLVAIGAPILIVAGSDKKQAIKAISYAQWLQGQKQ
jgi:hypothetical protein